MMDLHKHLTQLVLTMTLLLWLNSGEGAVQN